MAGDDGAGRIAGVAQKGLEGGQVEGARQAVVGREREAEVACDGLGGLCGAQLRRADDRVRLEPDPGQERPEPVRLLLTLVGERPRGVVAGPGLGIAGVGVAQEVELDQGLRSSTSPVTR